MSTAAPDENDTPHLNGAWVWMFVRDVSARLVAYKIKTVVTGIHNEVDMDELVHMAFLGRVDIKTTGITYRLHMFVPADTIFVPAPYVPTRWSIDYTQLEK